MLLQIESAREKKAATSVSEVAASGSKLLSAFDFLARLPHTRTRFALTAASSDGGAERKGEHLGDAQPARHGYSSRPASATLGKSHTAPHLSRQVIGG